MHATFIPAAIHCPEAQSDVMVFVGKTVFIAVHEPISGLLNMPAPFVPAYTFPFATASEVTFILVSPVLLAVQLLPSMHINTPCACVPKNTWVGPSVANEVGAMPEGNLYWPTSL
jgi:hypothetical protein